MLNYQRVMICSQQAKRRLETDWSMDVIMGQSSAIKRNGDQPQPKSLFCI